MTNWYWLAFGLSFTITVVSTLVIRRLAWRWQIVDHPQTAPERKRHLHPTPLLGGLAVIVGSLSSLWLAAAWGPLVQPGFPPAFVVGLGLAAGWIAIGGFLDDRRQLKPGPQILWPLLATITIIVSGIGVRFITNPFGGLLFLNQWQLLPITVGGLTYQLTLWADLFTAVWLMGMMYTTKILDGLDGLVSGIGVIGALIVFLLTLRPEVNQPSVAILALSLAGAAAGFLIFNWHPAKIFLGESGALYIGLLLGVMAIISGGKIATALLIMGLPILDLAWVILQRLSRNRSPFRTADRRHLHFRLLDAGLSTRQSVLMLYGLTLLFGISTLLFHGRQKVYALLVLVGLMAGLAGWVARRASRRAGPDQLKP
ncbi:MAG: undecaprenyl/decaprenyl-phosphate alpha-N-acetylglucosaminyl 1-phosphate transferase [Candidatus Kerfeldbacteria bacterium]|nr:undecaprenyl/decaprenyl-phosphate alpha-N-acetylglucosaminyl 1-phosphate transferase [Candidatus Kerfeldbacteria bacterium]